MRAFTFNTTQTLRFGSGVLTEVGMSARDLCCSRVLIVTDPGIVSTGIIAMVEEALAAAGVQSVVFDRVSADPTSEVVENAADAGQDVSAVIGVGGGSSLDVAKLVAVLAKGGAQLADLYGINKVRGGRLPLILVPTTAGTGSEVTPIAIVTTPRNEKVGVVSPVLLPDVALLDPDLTLGLSPHVTAATGVDAMVHAIEAFTSASPNNNPLSRSLAKQALALMGPALLRAVEDGANVAARSDMMLGAMLAGQAFANSPVAAVHALAYPLGGRFHIPHGLSNALVLPHVLRFNVESTYEPYAELAPIVFPDLRDFEGRERAEALCNRLASLSRSCGLPQRLRDVGIDAEDLQMLASDAMNQTRLLVNNPRPVSESDALAIYQAAW